MGTYVSLGILIDRGSVFTTKQLPNDDGLVTVVRLGTGTGQRVDIQTSDPEALRSLARCLLNAASEHERLAGNTLSGEPHRAMGQAENGAA